MTASEARATADHARRVRYHQKRVLRAIRFSASAGKTECVYDLEAFAVGPVKLSLEVGGYSVEVKPASDRTPPMSQLTIRY